MVVVVQGLVGWGKVLSQTHTQKNLKPNDDIFGASIAKHYGNHYREMRKTLANKLNRPDLLGVRLYDFRHFYGTMRYMTLRDIPLTAQDMGHTDRS